MTLQLYSVIIRDSRDFFTSSAFRKFWLLRNSGMHYIRYLRYEQKVCVIYRLNYSK